jgi:hypothetical protein
VRWKSSAFRSKQVNRNSIVSPMVRRRRRAFGIDRMQIGTLRLATKCYVNKAEARRVAFPLRSSNPALLFSSASLSHPLALSPLYRRADVYLSQGALDGLLLNVACARRKVARKFSISSAGLSRPMARVAFYPRDSMCSRKVPRLDVLSQFRQQIQRFARRREQVSAISHTSPRNCDIYVPPE